MRTRTLTLLVGAVLAGLAHAGPDDDAIFESDGTTLNQIPPIQDPAGFADFPTNIDLNTGLRIMPPTESTLFTGQRFDLRVETQIPAASEAPELISLTVNGTDVTESFLDTVALQDAADETGNESGKTISDLLYGNTARNLFFSKAGTYVVEARVRVDGEEREVANVYRVARFNGSRKTNRVVFFLGDAMGQPMRTAARIYSKGIFEGRAQGKLNYDEADEIALIQTASYDSIITDSAPGMANYITGVKQPNNALNVSADNTPENGLDNPRVETLMEYVKRTRGWAIGVVSDAYITDATPGSSNAHVRSRGARDTIAQQFLGYFEDGTAQDATGFDSLMELNQPLDVILGGGARYWVKNSNDDLEAFWQEGSSGRSDEEEDLFFDVAPDLGYQTVRTLDEMNDASTDEPLLGIFGGDGRAAQSALDDRNIPAALDRLVARGAVTINGKDASDPALGLGAAPKGGTACGATVQECFNAIPNKSEMVAKAIETLEGISNGRGWFLLVEQSHIDKLSHPLELERAIYEVIEMDNALGVARDMVPEQRSLIVVTADHAQPQSIIGVALPAAIGDGIATGGCFETTAGGYPITLGTEEGTTPCPLQDVIGTFNDGTFPTYVDENGDNFPDDSDPSVKLMVEQAGRPTYSTDFLTNPIGLFPGVPSFLGGSSAVPNPQRDPDGLLLTGNMPTSNTPASAGTAAKGGDVSVAPHSSDDVPLLAYGPSAEIFGGVYENSDVSVRIAAALSGRKDKRNLLPENEPKGNRLQFPGLQFPALGSGNDEARVNNKD